MMRGLWILGVLLALAGWTAHAAEGEAAKTAEAPKKEPKDMNADEAQAAGLCPVCKQESKPVYRVELGDKIYNFHSRDCKKTFAASPEKFGAKLSDADKAKREAKKTDAGKTAAEEPKTEDDGMMMGK
ncbi:MAG: hypothetical protein HS116_10635 [Planctomycetes bacterium]|nr:hypothetical protein [Planctomycetota bacterium]